MSSLRETIKFISTCTELEELKVVIRMALERRDALGRINVAVIRPGEKIKFRCKDGTYMHGTFVRRMKKNVEVRCGTTTWRVSPQFIERDVTPAVGG